RKSQTLTPLDPEPYVSLARIYIDLQSFARAEAEIQAALAQDHDHPGAHMVLSDLKRAQEDFPAAVEVLEGLHERGIEDALMRRAVGDALKRTRQDAALYAGLVAAAGRTPAAPADLVALARFLSSQGAHRRAGEILLDAAPLGGTPPAAAQATFEAGTEFLAARLFPRAAELFSGLAQPAAGDAGADPARAGLRAAALFNLGV